LNIVLIVMKLFNGCAVYVTDKMKNQYILIIIRENRGKINFICPKQLRWQTVILEVKRPSPICENLFSAPHTDFDCW
jgi:hypothetical protein